MAEKSPTLTRLWVLLIPCVLLAAHHLRAGEPGAVLMWLTAPLLLRVRQRWVPAALGAALLFGTGIWVLTAVRLVSERVELGQPWLRLAAILGAVALGTALCTQLLRGRAVREQYGAEGSSGPGPGLAAFLLTATLLGIVMNVPSQRPLLLLDRFVTGGGWLTAWWLAAWAGWLAHTLQDPRRMMRWRPRIWLLFSTVFFAQLALGLGGLDRLLMSGNLHLPVPALIVAGPIFRAAGFFMPILFGATVLLVGPAWCSWLCYIGAWDDRLARRRRRPQPLPRWRRHVRLAIVVVVVIAAASLRGAGVSGWTAAAVAAVFGLLGVALMALWSSRTGAMAHCTTYCPLGWFATRLGWLSPFRLQIDEGCNHCGACRLACRYDALSSADLDRRRPGEACTLCGDCIGACRGRNIDLRLGWRSGWWHGPRARQLFIVLVTSAHAVFLAVARM